MPPGSQGLPGLQLAEQDDKPYFAFSYGDGTQGNTSLMANTWYNVAWVYDIVGGVQEIYVNGKLDGTSSGHSSFQTSATAYIGLSCCVGQMDGLVEDLGVFDAALTQSQIQALISSPEPTLYIDMMGLFGIGMIISIFRPHKLVNRLRSSTEARAKL